MSIVVVWASPNMEGLTEACKEAVKKGIETNGKEIKEIHLNKKLIERCNVCGTGFGDCASEGHICFIKDDFAEIRKEINGAEALVLITPVYWGEMSEPLKAFMDRLRRCTAKSGELRDKNCVVIAAAGGSGNGAVNCLEQMDRYAKNMFMNVLERIPVTRFSKDYILETITECGKKL